MPVMDFLIICGVLSLLPLHTDQFGSSSLPLPLPLTEALALALPLALPLYNLCLCSAVVCQGVDQLSLDGIGCYITDTRCFVPVMDITCSAAFVTDMLCVPVSGYETTSMALTYALYELSRHADIQQRVVEEVDRFGREREPHFSDLAQFPLIDAVLKEGMRLHPPVTPLIALVNPSPEGHVCPVQLLLLPRRLCRGYAKVMPRLCVGYAEVQHQAV